MWQCGQDYRLSRRLGIACSLEPTSRSLVRGWVVDVRTFDSSPPDHRTRPWLGLRRRPGRLALAVFRLPLPLYRAGWGWLLGRTFLMLVHAGRKTGQPHAMTAMVLHYDAVTHEAVICSGWGPTTDWIRNIRARSALKVQIGRESFTPRQRFLDEDQSFAVTVEFCLRHPGRLGVMRRVLGWDLRTEAAIREFVRTHPFVAFRPDSTV
jgi:deazaflavin-dependent oxidoreductase (nitroreductase family)